MSVQKRGKRYEVRWRAGGRRSSRTFDRKSDAVTFEADVRRRQQLGSLATTVMQSRMTLSDFIEQEWWPRYAVPNLAADTRRRYREILATHLIDRVGDYELRAITPMLVEDVLAQLAHAHVPPASQRKALMLLQGILRRAEVRGLIPSNPVRAVSKPKQPPTQTPQPLAPETVEQIRGHMLKAWQSQKRGTGRSPEELQWWRARNVTMVSLMAYGGLRPAEVMRASWDDLDARSLHVEPHKARTRPRDVDVLAPLAQDLAEWRLASGRPGGGLIVPTVGGQPWNRESWANWRGRVYVPAARSAGVTGDMRPYRLRGSFCSLLLWAGGDLVSVAEQAGHDVATLARYYAGSLKALRGQPRVPADEAIRMAREQTVREATG